MRSNTRWLNSILATSKAPTVPMPWARDQRQKVAISRRFSTPDQWVAAHT